MTDFVLQQNLDRANILSHHNVISKFKNINRYATFLKQPLELWMFVPCDEDGNVLEEPESLKGYYETDKEGMETERKLREQYQKAKERCMFEGFETFTIEEIIIQLCEYHHEGDLKDFSIEDLYNCWFDSEIKLTQTAIKQIGL